MVAVYDFEHSSMEALLENRAEFAILQNKRFVAYSEHLTNDERVRVDSEIKEDLRNTLKIVMPFGKNSKKIAKKIGELNNWLVKSSNEKM
jgi:hypothetical protein